MGEHTPAYLAGVVVGILFVAACLVVIKIKSGGRGVLHEFDERQELVRGRAFKYGFFTLLIYFCAASLLNMAEIRLNFLDSTTIDFIGLCIGVVVFAAYAIWNDAYFSMQDRPRIWILIFAVMFVLNLIGGIRGLTAADPSRSYGVLGENPLNFCVGTMCGVLVVIITARQIISRKQGEDE